MCSSTSFLLIGDELIQLEKKCMPDEQFHQVNNKQDVTKQNKTKTKNKKTKKREGERERERERERDREREREKERERRRRRRRQTNKQQNTTIRTVTRKQSKQIVVKTKNQNNVM